MTHDLPGSKVHERKSHVSTFIDLINTLSNEERVDVNFVQRLTAVKELLVNVSGSSEPFLTVLLRTQGRRTETLKDALLCLAAQTNQDFEVIVLEHNATPQDAGDVQELIARLEPQFAQQVSLIKVDGGLRGRPLNAGIEVAKGRYVAVFDDDDLLFANWVEEFYRASAGTEGQMLRAVVANQSVAPELWSDNVDGVRTKSRARVEFPVDFDLLKHLVVNYSPFMSWAFPRSLFSIFGLRFDEELTVCEDWDMILRGSLICGVAEIPELTSIYRRWQDGGASSYTSHSSESWKASEQRVIDRINSGAIMLPPGSLLQLRNILVFNDGLQSYRFLFNGNQLRQPLGVTWKAMSPVVRLAVRLRNKLRRLRAR